MREQSGRTVNLWASVCVILMNVILVQSFTDLESLNKKATYLDGKVGSHVILNCPLDFPQDDPIPYVLRWFKDVSKHLKEIRFMRSVYSCIFRPANLGR